MATYKCPNCGSPRYDPVEVEGVATALKCKSCSHENPNEIIIIERINKSLARTESMKKTIPYLALVSFAFMIGISISQHRESPTTLIVAALISVGLSLLFILSYVIFLKVKANNTKVQKIPALSQKVQSASAPQYKIPWMLYRIVGVVGGAIMYHLTKEKRRKEKEVEIAEFERRKHDDISVILNQSFTFMYEDYIVDDTIHYVSLETDYMIRDDLRIIDNHYNSYSIAARTRAADRLLLRYSNYEHGLLCIAKKYSSSDYHWLGSIIRDAVEKLLDLTSDRKLINCIANSSSSSWAYSGRIKAQRKLLSMSSERRIVEYIANNSSWDPSVRKAAEEKLLSITHVNED